MSRTYPGSKMPIKTFTGGEPSKPREKETFEEFILGKPKTFLVKNEPQDFYAVGNLADALNRRSVTIRKWENDGVIPSATFILPSDDKRGRRRLYTRDQVLGLRKIAEEEGLLVPNANGKWKSIEETNFRDRALKLFKELENS